MICPTTAPYEIITIVEGRSLNSIPEATRIRMNHQRKPTNHHRRPTVVSDGAPSALVVTPTCTLLNSAFVGAVQQLYVQGHMNNLAARLVVPTLKSRLAGMPYLPPWDETAIGAAVSYLAGIERISLPIQLPRAA